MVEGDDELARGRIPKLGGFFHDSRQDPSTFRPKRPVRDTILMVKGGDELARGRIPELGGFVPACRQDPSTVRTKRHILNSILMGKGGDGQRQRLLTMDD